MSAPYLENPKSKTSQALSSVPNLDSVLQLVINYALF